MIKYQAHVSEIGWMPEVEDGAVAGTTGQSKALECYRITQVGHPAINVHAFAHVQDIGWSNGNILNEDVGSTGLGKHIEAVKIGLVGEESLISEYDIWYRLHVQNLGWLNWSKNGEINGTVGGNLRAEAIQIEVHKKEENFNPVVNELKPYQDLTPASAVIPKEETSTLKRQQLLAVAEKFIGYRAEASGKSQFGTNYGDPYGDWCAYFVHYCADTVSLPFPNKSLGYYDGYAPHVKDWAIKTGRYTGDPQPGYYVLFDFNGNGTPDHIGIVKEVISSDHVISIEGNTGNPVGVYQKDRKTGILAYVNPF